MKKRSRVARYKPMVKLAELQGTKMWTPRTIDGHSDRGSADATDVCVCAPSSQRVGGPRLCGPPSFPHRTAGLLPCPRQGTLSSLSRPDQKRKQAVRAADTASPQICAWRTNALAPRILTSSIPPSVLRSSALTTRATSSHTPENLADCPFKR